MVDLIPMTRMKIKPTTVRERGKVEYDNEIMRKQDSESD